MSFLENFYGVLFTPENIFEQLKEKKPVVQAFLIVLGISLISPLMNFSYHNPLSLVWLILGMLWSVIIGVFSWFFVAVFIELLAYIFNQSGKLKEFLVLSGFALIPWVLICPIALLKEGGLPGIILSILLGLIVWFWVLFLEIKALTKAYNFSPLKVVLFAMVPFIAFFLVFGWCINFILTFLQIIKF